MNRNSDTLSAFRDWAVLQWTSHGKSDKDSGAAVMLSNACAKYQVAQISAGLGEAHDHLPCQQVKRVQVFMIKKLQHIPLHPLRVELADLADDLLG